MLSNYNKQKGFTLVEMLVAIAIFMVVMTVAVGSLVSIVDANRKAEAIKTVINNINSAMENISKNMRIGTDYYCYSGNAWTKNTGDCGTGSSMVKYLSGDGINTVYYRYKSDTTGEEGNIQRCTVPKVNDDGTYCALSDNNPNWQSLTAPAYILNVTNMKFYVLGADTKTTTQPRVFITMEGVAGSKDSTKTKFSLQTTVSQRARQF